MGGFQENPDRKVCKGNPEGKNGVSSGNLRAERGFQWDPEGQKRVFSGES